MMLLDEPFGALDPLTRRDIQQEFRLLQERLQKTMVFVTHDVREALLLAHRIGLIKDGKMVVLGPPSELLHSPDPEAQAFAACATDGELPGSVA
jgi:osmoprotectant transport system ATP-binding protein